MSTINIPLFMEAATDAARLCGIIARRLQGKVPNETKETDAGQYSDFARRLKGAKTVVDDINEEICINLLRRVLPTDTVVLDGEEATPDSAFFPATSGSHVLVLDALDGTLSFTEGRERFGCNIALFSEGRMLAAMVYYPRYDFAAVYTEGDGPFRVDNFHANGLVDRSPLQRANLPKNPNELFIDYRVPKAVSEELKAAGYSANPNQRGINRNTVESALDGSITTFLTCDMEVRDMIPHAIVTSIEGATATDWAGNPIIWPAKGGAVPNGLFSMWPVPPEVSSILKRHCGTAR